MRMTLIVQFLSLRLQTSPHKYYVFGRESDAVPRASFACGSQFSRAVPHRVSNDETTLDGAHVTIRRRRDLTSHTPHARLVSRASRRQPTDESPRAALPCHSSR